MSIFSVSFYQILHIPVLTIPFLIIPCVTGKIKSVTQIFFRSLVYTCQRRAPVCLCGMYKYSARSIFNSNGVLNRTSLQNHCAFVFVLNMQSIFALVYLSSINQLINHYFHIPCSPISLF